MHKQILAMLEVEDKVERYPHTLEEKYPRIMGKIADTWGTPECGEYLSELMLDTRNGSRAGFPPDVAADLLMLSRLNQTVLEMNGVASGESPDFWTAFGSEGGMSESDGMEFRRDPHSHAGTASLFSAVLNGAHEVVHASMLGGAVPDVRDHHGRTPLILASMKGDAASVASLLKFQADATLTDNFGNTALHWACNHGHLSIARALVAHGAEIDAVTNSRWTPLLCAAANGHFLLVAYLVSKGADVDVASIDGWTALHKAVIGKHTEIARLLLSREANPLQRSSSGLSAIDIAKKYELNEILQAIEMLSTKKVA